MAARLIRLRYAAVCLSCQADLDPGARGWWGGDAKAVRCETCAGDDEQSSPLEVPPAPIESGSAGASAQRAYDRRRARADDQKAAMKARHPILGRIVAATMSEPHSTTSWSTGAHGERHLGAHLDSLADAGVIALHDRRIPGSRANIDHIAITPSGIWVIDAKRYKGCTVELRDKGGWLAPNMRLYVDGRDRTSLVSAMRRQVGTVWAAIGPVEETGPVRPALCFVDAYFSLLGRPLVLDGVLIATVRALKKRLVKEGPLGPDEVEQLARRLSERLPPA